MKMKSFAVGLLILFSPLASYSEPSAPLVIRSYVDPKVKLASGVVIVDSEIRGNVSVDENALISRSQILANDAGVKIGLGALIYSTVLKGSASIGRYSRVMASSLNGDYHFDEEVIVNNSTLVSGLNLPIFSGVLSSEVTQVRAVKIGEIITGNKCVSP